jgi:protein-S-isoprenylcysteine O-methyltransferase Ste14
MPQIVAFVLCSVGLIYVSRASLRAPGSHGFYRFFAWEFILTLVLLQLPGWFTNPLAWNQILSWLLLAASLVPLVFGVHAIRTRGRPTAQRADEPQLLAFEKTTQLITGGIFAYIRHPLYSSLLLLTWGAFFKAPSFPGAALALASTGFLFLTARADEAECRRFFGPEYEAYMQRTRRFVPFLF